jgi:hypothetical protein
MRKIFKLLLVVVMAPVMFLAGCAMIMPTVVPPMTKEMGYHVPHITIWGIDISTMGFVEGSYAFEVEKLKLWQYSVDRTLEATETARNGIMDLLTVVGLGGTAALPFAAKHVPKGAQQIKKEEV